MKSKIEIKNRWTGKIIFEFETENNTVVKTVAEYVRQSRADLRGADLRGADLRGADLDGADLEGADLRGADLSRIKYDFFGRMVMQRHEIPSLRDKLVVGEVNGSVYEGDCCCFVGTVAKACGKHYRSLLLKPDSGSPTEKWFMGIRAGDTPESSQIVKITVEWIDEFLGLIDKKELV